MSHIVSLHRVQKKPKILLQQEKSVLLITSKGQVAFPHKANNLKGTLFDPSMLALQM